MLEIIWASGSPMAWPIQLALLEKKIPHRSTQISFSNGDNQTEEFLSLSPRGKVPVLRDGDIALYESHAIIDYLERTYPDNALLPIDRGGQARDLAHRAETTYIYPAADPAISYTSYSSTLKRNEWDLEQLQVLAEPLVEEFQRWEQYLEARIWLGRDDAPGQSDCFFIPILMYMNRFGFDYRSREMTNLAAYYERVIKRDSVQKTWPPHWRTSQGDPTFRSYCQNNR